MQMNPSSKHHYVPVFYMKPWTGIDGKVQAFRKIYDGSVVNGRKFPSEICFEYDLYKNGATGVDSVESQKIEMELLSPIDNAASQFRDRLLKGESNFSHEDMSKWVQFLISSVYRHPNEVMRLKSKVASGWIDTVSNLMPLHSPELVDELNRFKNLDGLELESEIENTKTALIAKMLSSKNIGNFIMNMKWAIRDIEDGFDLMTSDYPSVKTNGLNVDGGHIILALNPKKLFIAAKNDEVLDLLASGPGKNLSRYYNINIVENCSKFVISTDSSQERFIRNHFKK